MVGDDADAISGRQAGGFRQVWHTVRDALWPPHCIGCGTTVEGQPGLCPACWKSLTFISAPQCVRCGLPFPYEVADKAVCAACAAEPPAYGRGRAAVLYDDASRRLVLGFKHGDRLDATGLLAGWIAFAARDLIGAADLIVPVPLHWLRLAARRYNQAAVLARRLAQQTQIAYAPGLLVRRRRTAPLGHKGRSERRKAVKGAFAVPDEARTRLDGRRVLLVDDVLTSGATAEECAKVLKKAGAAAVDVVALARTPFNPI
jgi:ComF family protein